MNSKHPLGLPEGSVRAILAVIIVASYCIGKACAAPGTPEEWLVATVLAVYFAGRKLKGKDAEQ